ncbi:hypothetical protein LCGC14_1218540 [marine sediment metagenome]|uniref:Uncharacterized protein n=1 Tax=marine sediment metagenome TaxID=412755 RepID=A0A0F9LG16_9ZZZZ
MIDITITTNSEGRPEVFVRAETAVHQETPEKVAEAYNKTLAALYTKTFPPPVPNTG